MSVQIVVGAQWGDEGKGKIIDVLSVDKEMVIRYQGGANAGHTVYIGEKKYVLHLIPSGILREDVKCLIGGGVVLDPKAFCDELEVLDKAGISYNDRLFISPRTHIILPYHKKLDAQSESNKGKKQIGTTRRGIGPAYADKYNRLGIRAIDLLNPELCESKITSNLEFKNFVFEKYYKTEPEDVKETIMFAREYAEKLRPYIKETLSIVHEYQKTNKPILIEGAQGALLDIDYGSFPYVTSSHPVAGGAFIGSGVAPSQSEISGVMKAYLTRVGNGPFPTELEDETGEKLRRNGHEFGATTGRPRRCGWLDLVAARYSVQVNGLTNIALTKLDVLSDFENIKVCVSYKHNGKEIEWLPADQNVLENITPVYKELKGWNCSIDGIQDFDELPKEAKDYIKFIESFLDIPVKYISTGQRRDQIIYRKI
ncbi:MAG: adenylosuccinate synthase [Calditrichaeota bacterium]|nr:MAG: adenylosuccinate synthase [Calditrichota bacterium]MBL1204209.1 adenylosuccinate synthase [Calditrichota bacterium]NOG44039.1 adenylosuccinate synthase [Calditrichota bacterium]